ncbi:MAG: hypothetical protein LBV54_04160 [Puniceicoccales bacterium]|jgi:hypothetical protein|nr:hypothetical protein [Puniceicoccales bacterium]
MKKKPTAVPVAAPQTKTTPQAKSAPVAAKKPSAPVTKPAPAPAPKAKPAPAAAPAPKPASASAAPVSQPASSTPAPKSRKALPGPTTIVALIDAGWGNQVFLRGEGGELSWDYGIPMTCRGANEWVWVSTSGAPAHTFKFVLNDVFWEIGANRIAGAGETFAGTPSF